MVFLWACRLAWSPATLCQCRRRDPSIQVKCVPPVGSLKLGIIFLIITIYVTWKTDVTLDKDKSDCTINKIFTNQSANVTCDKGKKQFLKLKQKL